MLEQPLINWPYLLAALLLLWFPRHWLRAGKLSRGKRRQREAIERFAQDGGNDPDDKSVRLRRELRIVRNYVDFFRAFAGSVGLWHFSFHVAPEQQNLIHAVCGVLSLIAVVIQTTRFRERVTFFAAIFYLPGLCMGVADPVLQALHPIVYGNSYSALMAFLLICAFNPVIPTPRMFLTLYGLILFLFNWILGAGFQLAWISSLLVLLPPLFSLMAKRPMVIFTRKRNLGW